eukprot:10737122-Prorocentrum_lima.AAC.1
MGDPLLAAKLSLPPHPLTLPHVAAKDSRTTPFCTLAWQPLPWSGIQASSVCPAPPACSRAPEAG